MAPNLGVTCSPYLSTVGVTGVTEARKLFGQADHRAHESGADGRELRKTMHLILGSLSTHARASVLEQSKATICLATAEAFPQYSQFAVVRAGRLYLAALSFEQAMKKESRSDGKLRPSQVSLRRVT